MQAIYIHCVIGLLWESIATGLPQAGHSYWSIEYPGTASRQVLGDITPGHGPNFCMCFSIHISVVNVFAII